MLFLFAYIIVWQDNIHFILSNPISDSLNIYQYAEIYVGIPFALFILADKYKKETRKEIYNPWLWGLLGLLLGFLALAVLFYFRHKHSKIKNGKDKYLLYAILSIVAFGFMMWYVGIFLFLLLL